MAPQDKDPSVPTTYQEIAERLRRDVQSGRWPLGEPIPGVDRLAAEYGGSRGTVHRAVQHLAAQGLLYSEGRKGTFIRPQGGPVTVVRDRRVYRDELGYFFDQNAKDWRTVGTPTQAVDVPPAHIADRLGVPRHEHVMIRDRALAPPDSVHAAQLATSYLPMWAVGELPILGAAKTGPGGIYDRLEGHAGAALEWDETVSARPADDREAQQLRLGSGLPVLVVTRMSRLADGRVVEVNETRMDASLYAVSYEVERDASAAWPRRG